MEENQIVSSSVVYDQIPPLSANHQWIVAQNLDPKSEDEIEFQIFYNVHDPLNHYRCQIPELMGKQVRGCFFGWVILCDHPRNLRWSLWNPATSKVIYLPRLKSIQSDSNDVYADYMTYCCLTSPPDVPNSFLLMTRYQKPYFVFCRLHRRKKKLRWIEMSYAQQLRNLTRLGRCRLRCLTCCNGKVYAYATRCFLVVELSIVVDYTGAFAINLLALVQSPVGFPRSINGSNYLVGTCKDIFLIYLDFAEVTGTICNVHLFKLSMDRNTWEELEDLQDATIFMDIGGYLYPEFHKLATGSELGGYIHMLCENKRIIHSYHVKDKSISLSSLPCLAGTSDVSTWPMLESKRLLEGDHKLEEDKKNKTVVNEVKSHDVEFIGTTDESQLLNLPYDVLEMIIESCVGVEYLNFRASCKLCYLAAPIIQLSNQTASKRLQLQEYSLISPWLMVFGKHTITLIDPMFGDKYFINTPHKLELVGELTIHCSKYGWLLMRKYSGPLFFFNPFTSDTHKLPVAGYLDSYDFSAPPTSPDCIVVGFSSVIELADVHIHFVGRESSWRKYALNLGNNNRDIYRFPAFYGGDVYALRNGKGVDVFKGCGVGNQNRGWKHVLDELPISSCTSKAHHFLVKCDHEYKCDQNLILVIVGEFGESVEVFIPNDAGKWDKIDDIGRHMIYIGDKKCLCMEAKTAKMENKIYFPRLHSGKIVFYSFETRKFHTFNGGNISGSFTDFFGTIKHLPNNAWIEPAWS